MVSGNKYHIPLQNQKPKKGDLPENLLPENNPVSGISPYRPFSAVACRVSTVACRVSPIACRVSALRLPFFWPSPAVFPPSRAVACRASTHRPAFFRRRLPCFCPLPAVFLPVACRVSARRLPSRAVLPPIARLSPPVACRASPIACRRLLCFHSSPGFSRLQLPCFCPSPAMFPPSPAVACRASPIARMFPPSPAMFLPVACHVPPIACRRVPRFRPSLGFFPAVACIVS